MSVVKHPDFVRVVVLNDIYRTRKESLSPQTIEEALENHGDVALALGWLCYEKLNDDPDSEVIAVSVSVHQADNLIIVHWHATGDIESAREAMEEFIDRTWEAHS